MYQLVLQGRLPGTEKGVDRLTQGLLHGRPEEVLPGMYLYCRDSDLFSPSVSPPQLLLLDARPKFRKVNTIEVGVKTVSCHQGTKFRPLQIFFARGAVPVTCFIQEQGRFSASRPFASHVTRCSSLEFGSFVLDRGLMVGYTVYDDVHNMTGLQAALPNQTKPQRASVYTFCCLCFAAEWLSSGEDRRVQRRCR